MDMARQSADSISAALSTADITEWALREFLRKRDQNTATAEDIVAHFEAEASPLRGTKVREVIMDAIAHELIVLHDWEDGKGGVHFYYRLAP